MEDGNQSTPRSEVNAIANNRTSRDPMRDHRSHPCHLCNKSFPAKKFLNRHFKRSHTEVNKQPYQCHTCPKGYPYKWELERHVHQAHSQAIPHDCIECEYKCKSADCLKKHLKTHHQNWTATKVDNKAALQKRPPHSKFCEKCNKSFSNGWSLNRHNIRFHSNVAEKPHQCIICPKQFTTRWELTAHVNCVHSIDRPYNCSNCENKFKTVRDLNAHLRTHDKNRVSFQCNYCDHQYISKNGLKFHLKRIHGSLKMESYTEGDNSQHVLNPGGSGAIIEASLEDISREVYHNFQDGHGMVQNALTEPSPGFGVGTENEVQTALWGCFCGNTYFSHDDLQSHWDEYHKPDGGTAIAATGTALGENSQGYSPSFLPAQQGFLNATNPTPGPYNDEYSAFFNKFTANLVNLGK